jgi:flavin-dependent dehydrogenase
MRCGLVAIEDRYDVAIVGARVAGSALARYLGDLGRHVLLVDRATFPSTTISTHFFRGSGLVSVLDDLGILEDALATGAPPLVCEYFYPGGMPEPSVGPPQDPGTAGYGLSIRREPLDALLAARAAASPTVTLVEGVSAIAVTESDGEVTGLTLRCRDLERAVKASLVVGADGHNSTVSRLVDARVQEDAGRLRAAFFCYVSGFPRPDGGPPDGPEFSVVEDEMAYVFPSDAGISCIAISVSLDTFTEMRGGGVDAFRHRLRHHRGLSHRFEKAHVESGLLGRGPQGNVVRVPVGPGWALVGDAGLHQDAWTGLGMDNAGVHARILAGTIDDWLAGRTSRERAMSRFHQARDAHALPGFHETVTIGRDLRQLS